MTIDITTALSCEALYLIGYYLTHSNSIALLAIGSPISFFQAARSKTHIILRESVYGWLYWSVTSTTSSHGDDEEYSSSLLSCIECSECCEECCEECSCEECSSLSFKILSIMRSRGIFISSRLDIDFAYRVADSNIDLRMKRRRKKGKKEKTTCENWKELFAVDKTIAYWHSMYGTSQMT